MDLRRLEIFAKVAELGSFSRAAEALFLTQPTISEHIRALEDELGVQLLDRLGRGAAPTRAGEIRTHYAGFFDPGFGWGDGSILGTKVVMEVRAREVPFMVYDGQTSFKMWFERLRSRPDRVYGGGLGSSYQRQTLTLSKHFKRG